ncbi:MAG TPA: TonB-dependent receptor plug domain-containing protein [Mucilaginibacter sp.]|nr:TonB-dependent receptor plug domain-containing protein [Mucilaginibacter sp.]
MKKLLFLGLVSCASCCFGQNESITDKLRAYSSEFTAEKAYLQFDKPYYATGDTLYFKAYLTMGERHNLAWIGSVLHVDLISPQNKIVQSINLHADNGISWGDFALSDTLLAGNYRVRAWTRWMRNDPGSFFEKVIPVGSLQSSRVPESALPGKKIKAAPDVQFLPEGGTLVADVASRIAFKATGTNGLGINVKGVVLDNANKEVCSFASVHLGMGSFSFTPQVGQIYRAKLTYANGTENIITLPEAETRGIALSVNNDSISKASVRIIANPAYFQENKGKSYRLLIYSGGIANTVNFRLDSSSMKMDIIKRRLFTGVATITLFSGSNEPLCERLIFVQNYDQLNLETTTNKTVYTPREKVHIDLHSLTRANEPSIGHFSVSVTDEAKVPENERDEITILSQLLLTSELKGYIEQPNYYFTNINHKTTADLDLVMLTHGYRRFEWKKLLKDEYLKPQYQPETALEIAGQATNLMGKPLAHGTVSLIQIPGLLISRQTDNKGNFVFKDLVFTDTGRFVLQAVNSKNKNYTKLIYKNDMPEPEKEFVPPASDTALQNMGPYMVNTEKQQEQLNMLGLGKGKMLKGVTIRGRKPDDKYFTFSLAGAGNADQVMHADEIEKIEGPLDVSLNGRLRGVVFRKKTRDITLQPWLAGGLGMGPMLVIVDGVEGADIGTMTASDVETVEVLKGANAAIYGMQGGNGVLIITTKQGGGLREKDITPTGILPITVNGFYKAREFYSPKYDVNPSSTHPDLRSTIYWQPELATDKDGNASFEYYNADGTGTYRVVIEGIDDKGNIGRQVYRYKVE